MRDSDPISEFPCARLVTSEVISPPSGRALPLAFR